MTIQKFADGTRSCACQYFDDVKVQYLVLQLFQYSFLIRGRETMKFLKNHTNKKGEVK